MVRIALGVLGIIVWFASFSLAVSVPDPSDYVLVAYRLTEAQEAMFNDSNGSESPFWKSFYGNPSAVDYAHLVPSINARARAVFESENDAQMTVWAAWGVKGLYLYFFVLDDNWVDYQIATDRDRVNDAVEFFLDENSSEYQSANPTVFYNQRWTMTTVNYQLRFGGTEAPSIFSFNQLDPVWQPGGNVNASIKHSKLTFAQGAAMGIRMECLPASDYTHRCQEWLIPWEHFSYTGIAMPRIGDKMAAVFGYNDVDGDMVTGVNELRWKTSDPNSLDDCWGDIEFGLPLYDVYPYNPDPYPYYNSPRCTFPYDSARDISTSLTLHWSPTNYLVDTARVQLSKQANFSSMIMDTAVHGDSMFVCCLEQGASYYWRVISAGSMSSTAHFYTIGDSFSSSIPTALSPYNGESNVPLPVSLSWTYVPWATNYRVQISSSIDFSTLVKDTIGTASTAMTIYGLLKDKTYYWSVCAITASGASAWSTTAAFTTMGALPDPVVLVSPPASGMIVADSVRLSWHKGSASSNRYALSIATDSNMTHTIIRDSLLTDTSFMFRRLTSSVTYYWRVKACNAAGWGAYSITNRFIYSRTGVLFATEALQIFGFNHTARTITYSLPKQCLVSISYYNLNGRLMSTLVNEIQSSGSHTIANPLCTFAKGSYVQVFKAGEITQKSVVAVVR